MKGYCTLCKKNLRMKSTDERLLELGFLFLTLEIEMKSSFRLLLEMALGVCKN